MSPWTRVAAFAAALGVAAGAAALAGASIEPLRDGADASHAHGGDEGRAHAPAAAGADGHGHGPGGLAVAEGGYRLAVEATRLPLGRPTELAFRVLGPGGEAVRDFDVEHERRMHVIVVRRDLTGYQHLHPRMDATGRWSVALTLPQAGVYRAYADFSTGGHALTLAADLHVAGPFAPRPLPAPSAVDRAGRYEVALDAGSPAAEAQAALAYRIARDGRPVTGVEPYLGADGHLVALREGDLAFLHVHPEEAAGRPDEIRFGATFPSPGRYRLFVQFKHDGAVRTAAHTVVVPS